MSNIDYSNVKIVIIDDDTMVLRSLKSAIKNHGMPVEAFESPEEGIEWIINNGADIVISDICMPKYDGFDVLRRIKDVNDRCDIIFITAHSQIDIAIRALREGASDFFEKPFTTSALLAAIERTKRFRLIKQRNNLLSNQINILNNDLLYINRTKNVMLGQSPVMKKLAENIMDIAGSNATVLIIGESGTGKELVAHAIHQSSPRKNNPFITLNCPSIPEDLFESEMFGHRRGAFTGAIETRGGYIEAAQGGTIFMDEIGDLPLKSQAKILRLLEQKTYLPVGEHKEKTADVRIIVATNQSLEKMVKEKTFREDLYYRLNVCSIKQAPLREHKEDIPLLALYFTLQFASEMGKSIEGIDNSAFRILSAYDYPGNIRELRNIMERCIIHCKHSGILKENDVRELINNNYNTSEHENWPMDTLNLKDVEQRLYMEALSRTNNNVSAAARLLGLSRSKLRRKIATLNINISESA